MPGNRNQYLGHLVCVDGGQYSVEPSVADRATSKDELQIGQLFRILKDVGEEVVRQKSFRPLGLSYLCVERIKVGEDRIPGHGGGPLRVTDHVVALDPQLPERGAILTDEDVLVCVEDVADQGEAVQLPPRLDEEIPGAVSWRGGSSYIVDELQGQQRGEVAESGDIKVSHPDTEVPEVGAKQIHGVRHLLVKLQLV